MKFDTSAMLHLKRILGMHACMHAGSAFNLFFKNLCGVSILIKQGQYAIFSSYFWKENIKKKKKKKYIFYINRQTSFCWSFNLFLIVQNLSRRNLISCTIKKMGGWSDMRSLIMSTKNQRFKIFILRNFARYLTFGRDQSKLSFG
jgi:hypothetical protein